MHRPLRVCLPSKERDDYVLFVRRKGCTIVTVRQRNRYIDECLRYCNGQFGYSDAHKISKSDLIKYGTYVGQTNRNYMTARCKLLMAFQWFHWLALTKRIANDPAKGLIASQLLSKFILPKKTISAW